MAVSSDKVRELTKHPAFATIIYSRSTTTSLWFCVPEYNCSDKCHCVHCWAVYFIGIDSMISDTYFSAFIFTKMSRNTVKTLTILQFLHLISEITLLQCNCNYRSYHHQETKHTIIIISDFLTNINIHFLFEKFITSTFEPHYCCFLWSIAILIQSITLRKKSLLFPRRTLPLQLSHFISENYKTYTTFSYTHASFHSQISRK